MRTTTVFAVLAAALTGAGAAFAAGLSDYEPLFPAFPCHDGWAACLVDGFEVDAGVVHDGAGRPLPSDLRLGWFDLEPTATFSPFAELSEYGGAAVVAAPSGEPPDEPVVAAAPTVDDGDTGEMVEDPPPSNTGNSGSNYDNGSTGSTGSAATSSGYKDPYTTTTAGSKGVTVDPIAAADPPPSVDLSGGTQQTSGSTRPGYGQNRDLSGGTQPATLNDPPPPPPEEPPEDAVVMVEDPVEPPPPPPPTDDSCDDLVSIEGPALLGRLRPGQIACLDARIGSSGTQTQKDKISRVLLINAEAAGDRKGWDRLMKRHLEDIDRSDPDLCFKYAKHLARGGVGRAWGVIKWADYALENKQRWSGTTYKTRVYALYQLKAEAAVKLWENTNEKLVSASGAKRDELTATEEKLRGMAKDYSLEWLGYARASGQDVKKPMALCVSAAGSKKVCKDG